MSYLKYFLLISAFLVPSFTRADEFVLNLGIGSLDTASSMRFGSMGIQEDLWGILKQRATLGVWSDDAPGTTGSAFISAQLGMEIDNSGLVGSLFFGPGAISSPDALLGGWFQFFTNLGFGFRDINHNYMGIMFRHISSSGLEMPNAGRDVLGLEIKFPL